MYNNGDSKAYTACLFAAAATSSRQVGNVDVNDVVMAAAAVARQ